MAKPSPNARDIATNVSSGLASAAEIARASRPHQVSRDLSREEAIAAARGIAEDRAVQAGVSRDSLKTVDVEDMPIAYLPGNAPRVRVRVAGAIANLQVPAAA